MEKQQSSGKATYFISDMHLGARYIRDPRRHEDRVVAFLESIAEDADTLYMVGDVLDYWYEYRKVVPRGYVRFFGALARLADRGVRIVWLTGNHDIWLFDYLRNEIGLEVVDGDVTTEIDGKNFFISHGDALGRIKTSYKLMRNAFRNRFCQWLYASIHPRWTVAFAQGWSKSSRKYDKREKPAFEGEMRENVLLWAEKYVKTHPETDFMVLGHHHVLVDQAMGPKSRIIILGDWIDIFSYGRYHNGNFELKIFEF